MFALLRVKSARLLPTPGLKMSFSSVDPSRFQPSRLENIEPIEDYRPGGLHPVAINDVLAQGRYRVVHKLGFGGSSTIWLARNRSGKLVTLKVMRADLSSQPIDAITELAVPRKLSECIPEADCTARSNIQTFKDYFVENGPNGSHLCLVSRLAGPSILSMSDCPGRRAGSRRLRRDLAKKVTKQVVDAVKLMHTAGFVHGDLTTSNILFRIAESVETWSDNDFYVHFGQPETEDVITWDHSLLGPHVPAQRVAPIDNIHWANSSFVREDVVIIDFGQSFSTFHPKKNYKPATVPHYRSMEARFEGQIGIPSDIWALACTIFEIRAGFPIFGSFLGWEDEILKEVVVTLGKLPEPWWSSFDKRHIWFKKDGKPKPRHLQPALLAAEKTSIKQKLARIGTQDVPPATGTDGYMMEQPNARLDEKEIELLGDLLEKMLCYRPRKRITINEVASHPWFSLE